MYLTITRERVTLDGATATLEPPLDLAGWADDLARLHTFTLVGAREAGVDAAYLADLGTRLFRRVFVGDVLAAYQDALAVGPVHLGLSAAGRLAALPWELLYDPQARHYLGAAGPVTLFRRVSELAGTGSPAPAPAPATPTRLLLVFAPPGDPPVYAPSEIVAMVREPLAAALADGRVVLDYELSGTVAALNDRLNDPATRPHLVHFFGHGGVEGDQGVLGFADDAEVNESAPLGGVRLRDLFAGKGVQGVLLTACHSGQVTGAADPLAMAARAILGAGVPAVVAQQFAARVETTQRFFARLYAALDDGDPLERAAAFGRHALWVETPPGDDNPLGFAVPVCYLAAGRGPRLGPALRLGSGQAPPEPPGLAAVESAPPTFTGRERDVRRVEAAWRTRALVALCGGGGVGKTALAAHLARANRWRFPGGLFWASARGREGFSVDHVAEAVLHGLGVELAGVRNSPAEARRQLRGRACLVVVDNFEAVPRPNRRPIYDWLRSLPQGTTALLTSRERLKVKGLQTLSLAPLDRAAARDLFRELLADWREGARVTGEEVVAVGDILALLGGWPLALEIVAALAADASLGAIRDDLRSDRAEALTAEIEEEEESIVRSLGTSYDRLGEGERALFRYLGALWGDFGPEAAAVVGQVEDGETLKRGLAALVKRSLVERLHPAIPRWRIHGAVSLFARSRLQVEEGEGEGEGAVRAARLRAAEYFRDYAQLWQQGLDTAGLTEALRARMDELRPQLLAQLPVEIRAEVTDEQLMELVISTGVAQARAALEMERANVGAAIQWAAKAGEHGLVQKLVDAVDPFLRTAGYWRDLVQYERLALAAAREAGDERAVAVWAHNLAVTLDGLGEKAEAEALYRESRHVREGLGDAVFLAKTLHQQGVSAYGRGEWDEALRLWNEAVTAFEAAGDHANAAKTLHNIGMVHQDRGDYDAALEHYRSSLEIKKQLGDRAGVASSLHQIGTVHQLRGDYEAALDHYRRSLKTFEQLGDRAGVASSLHQIGNVHYLQGDYEAALAHYRRSLEIEQQLGDRAGVASSLGQIGIVHELRGDYEAALDHYRQAGARFEELGARREQATVLHQIGTVHELRGDYEAALEHYRRSLEIAEQLGSRAGVASSLHQIGIVHQLRGDYDAALAHYRRSLKTFEQLGDRAGVATSLHQIGMVHQDRGDYDAALDHYRRSLEIAEQLGDRAGVAKSLGQIGQVAQLQGDYVAAVRLWAQALATFEALGMPERDIVRGWFAHLREELGAERFEGVLQEAGVG